MANIVKYLLYVFIPILVIFAMSHNASAFDLTRDVVLLQGNYQSVINTISPSDSCAMFLDSRAGVRNNCTDSALAISGLRFTIPERTYNPGDFLQVVLYTGINQENNSSDVFMRGLSLSEGAAVWDIVDVDMQSVNGSTGIVKITLRAYTNYTYNSNTHYLSFSSSSAIFVLYHNEYIYFGKTTAWGTIGGTDYSNQIQDVISAINNIDSTDYTQQLNTINNSINGISNGISDINEHNEKEEQAVEDIENQSTDDVDVGDQSGMTNAVGVVSGIFNQIGSVQATDCNFTANFGHLNLGQLNFCTGKENFPFIINFVSSIFTLIVVVGTILILVKQVLGLYDWARKD